MIGINQFELQGIAASPIQNYIYKNGNGQYGIFYIEVQEGDKRTMYGVTLFSKTYDRYAGKINKGDNVYVRGRITASQYTGRNGDRKISYTLSANWIEIEQADISAPQAPQTTQYGGQTFETGPDINLDPNDLPF